MKLKIFRIKTIYINQNRGPIYRFVLGVERAAVSAREGVRLEDVLELENEVVINVNITSLQEGH